MDAPNKGFADRVGMRRKDIFDDVKASLLIVSIRHIVSVAVVLALGLFSTSDSYSQDFASLLDVSYANGESLRNYDVSYRITTISDFPEEKEALAEIERRYKENNWKLREELEIYGRIVVDKGDSINPEKLLSVLNYRELVDGKNFEFSEFLLWDKGILTKLLTLDPKRRVSRGECTIERCYKDAMMPYFESYSRMLLPPPTDGYWDDHSVFWDWAKSKTANLEVLRLPNGRMRIETSFPQDRYVAEYDPISSLVVFETTIPFNPETGENDFSRSLPARITWEKIKNVYCLKGVVARNQTEGVMNDTVTSFLWHQCNEEIFEFPTFLKNDLSLQSCSNFLTEGQSKLTDGR